VPGPSLHVFLYEFNIKLLAECSFGLSKTDTPTTPGRAPKQRLRSQKMQKEQAIGLPQTRHSCPKHVSVSTARCGDSVLGLSRHSAA
jgi:hypothetical protein